MMALISLATTLLFYVATCQIAPQWGTLSCDTSLGGIFPPGPADNPSRYRNYYRWYKFTASYPTRLRRDVLIQTCIEEDGSATFGANILGNLHPSTTTEPNNGNAWTSTGSYGTPCETGEVGQYRLFTDVPEGEWDIGISNVGANAGGRYKVSVQCLNTPFDDIDPANLANSNITTYFDEDYGIQLENAWINRGSQKLSCGQSAMFSTLPSDVDDTANYFQVEILDYATQIMLTTCDPETIYNPNPSRYPGASSSTHVINWKYWDFGTNDGNRKWRQQSSGYRSTCARLTLGGNSAFDFSPLTMSPGTYFIRVDSTNGEQDYVLSMLCWDDATVKAAVVDDDFRPATSEPTSEPTTSPPTRSPTARPTNVNTTDPTMSPSAVPTQAFDGNYNNVNKAKEIGDISCGIHRHDVLEKKQSNWYKFSVGADLSFWAFDTCLNDQTKFNSCLKLYELDGDEYKIYNNEQTCAYCGFIADDNNYLPAGEYAIEIYGSNRFEDYGEYILRMGCDLKEYDYVQPVTETASPTPAPTGVAPIPARDGRIVGDISCGITVTGETSAQRGDFHKFTVTGEGVDWVKFDTCDETSFNNYLFVYDHWNQTGHEQWNFGRDYSIGFHFEHTTTCNSLTMHDLTPGVYYVNIDGFNYYFDYGTYTIKMQCSDSSNVRAASNYEEYRPGLEWWAILLIILAVLLCCGGLIFAAVYYKKKKDLESGSGSSPVNPTSPDGGDSPDGDGTEMQETGYQE